MIELSVNNLTKYYGANKIFENISFEVKTGERIGLIGQNGCGKTTMMKVIMGLEENQGGEINLRKGVKAGYLSQIPTFHSDTTVMDVIRSAFVDIFQMKDRMVELEYSFSQLEGENQGNRLEKAIAEYGRLSEEYELKGGYELETRINKITEGLKITDTLKDMLFNELSGGERTRVILAKILLEEPDLLLLDEPTNHLDLATIEWLEGFLKEYKGSVLVISHDRYFLDSIAVKIIELEINRANTYLGNYSYYVLEKERRFLLEYKVYLNQQKKIEQMEKQIERYRIWGAMRDSEKMFKRAKELEKRLEKIDVLERPVIAKRKVRFDQDTATRTGKVVLAVEDVSKSFEDKELLQEVNLALYYQDSACIIGKNGCGKSTLLKIIMGEEEPNKGMVKIGAQVKIGYLPQHVVYENEDLTLLEYFSGLHNITYEEARFQLARVLFFKEDVYKKIKFLSGGEKSRLRLCSLTFEQVNVMILDEPTNHLDIDSREVLEKTLSEFEGTLLFVSHDRYFINKVADKIIEIENNNAVIYPGDYTYYLEEYEKNHTAVIELNTTERQNGKKLNVMKKQPDTSSLTKDSKKDTSVRAGKSNYQSKKLELLEVEIGEMEAFIKSLENKMNECNSDVEQLNELFREKEKAQKVLDNSYIEWEKMLQ